MSEAARSINPDEPDAEAASADAERFPREFLRNMAKQGVNVKQVAMQAGWEPGPTLNVSGDELSEAVIRMRRGELEEETMSNPAPKAEPNLEHAPDLLAFQRRAAEQGLHVRLPSPNPNWDLPEPVDLGGASLGDMVVRLRRAEP